MAPSLSQRILARFAPFFRVSAEAKNYRLIAESGLFDPDWYCDFAPEIEGSGIDPIAHFLGAGAAAHLDPGPEFSMRGYLRAHPDVATAGMNPLLHYLHHGRREGREIVPAIDAPPIADGLESMAPFRWITPPPVKPDRKVAVIVHLYYAVLWPAMARALGNLPVPFDLVVTLPEPASDAAISAIIADFPDAAILASANRGRDLRPFLFALDAIAPARHELVCKLHTKLSRHRSDGSAWRREMLRALLGTPAETQRILDAFRRDPKLGLLAPAGNLLSLDGYLGKASNARGLLALARLAEIAAIPADSAFVGGSMFWLRPEALIPALRAAFRADDFDAENGDTDGTLAHAWERFIGVAVAAAGYALRDTADLSASRSARAAGDAKREARHGPPRGSSAARALLSGIAAVPFVSAPPHAAAARLSVCDARAFAAVADTSALFDGHAKGANRILLHDELRSFHAMPSALAAGVNLFGVPCPPEVARNLGESPMRSAYSFACDDGVLLPESGVVVTADGGLVGVTIENAFSWGGIQNREARIRESSGSFYAGWNARDLRTLDTLVLGGIGINGSNYGHFLFDGLPGLFLLAHAARARNREFCIAVPPLSSWQRECFTLAGLGDRLVRADGPVRCATVASNSLVSHHVDSPTRFCRPAFDAMRFAVPQDPGAPEKLFLARRGFRRSLRNAEAVEAHLRARGFAVVAPETFGVADQIRLVSRARIVIGQTGAALANLAFAAPGTKVLEIMPTIRPDRWIRNTAAIFGFAWHVLLCAVDESDFVGLQVGDRFHPAEDFSFTMPIAMLDAALDAIEDAPQSAGAVRGGVAPPAR